VKLYHSRNPDISRTRLTKLIRLARLPNLWGAAIRGTIPSLEHQSVPFGSDFATVIDVGASRGQFATFAAHRFPDAKVICFEPLDESADALERVSGERVEVRRVALGGTPGSAEIHISASDDSSSLLPIGERQVTEFPGTATVGSRRIAVSTLDREFPEFPDRPCLLKIDVQGLEAEVLKGGTGLLEQVDEAFIECSFVELYEGQALAPEVIEQMAEAGFEVIDKGLPVAGNDGLPIQADILFGRPLAGIDKA